MAALLTVAVVILAVVQAATAKQYGCHSWPCQNFAQCSNTDTAPYYKCWCLSPWIGQTCDTRETCPEHAERIKTTCNTTTDYCRQPQCDGDDWAGLQKFDENEYACFTTEGNPIYRYSHIKDPNTDCRCARDQSKGQQVSQLCTKNGKYKTCQQRKKELEDWCTPANQCFVVSCEEGGVFYTAVQTVFGMGTICLAKEGQGIQGFSFHPGLTDTDCLCARAKYMGLNATCNADGSFVNQATCPSVKARATVVCDGRVGCQDWRCEEENFAAVQYKGAGGYCVTSKGETIGEFSWLFGDVVGKESDCKCARAQFAGENVKCNPDGSHMTDIPHYVTSK